MEILNIKCLKSNQRMNLIQKDLFGEPIYECNSCKSSHQVKISKNEDDLIIECMKCNNKMIEKQTSLIQGFYLFNCPNNHQSIEVQIKNDVSKPISNREQIIFSILCLTQEKPMHHDQNDLFGNPIYKCQSCKRPHKISIYVSNDDYKVVCLECKREMKRIKTLESPTIYNYTCINGKCQQNKKIIQIHKADK